MRRASRRHCRSDSLGQRERDRELVRHAGGEGGRKREVLVDGRGTDQIHPACYSRGDTGEVMAALGDDDVLRPDISKDDGLKLVAWSGHRLFEPDKSNVFCDLSIHPTDGIAVR